MLPGWCVRLIHLQCEFALTSVFIPQTLLGDGAKAVAGAIAILLNVMFSAVSIASVDWSVHRLPRMLRVHMIQWKRSSSFFRDSLSGSVFTRNTVTHQSFSA